MSKYKVKYYKGKIMWDVILYDFNKGDWHEQQAIIDALATEVKDGWEDEFADELKCYLNYRIGNDYGDEVIDISDGEFREYIDLVKRLSEKLVGGK